MAIKFDELLESLDPSLDENESLNESKLNEVLSESKFKDPIRFKISITESPMMSML